VLGGPTCTHAPEVDPPKTPKPKLVGAASDEEFLVWLELGRLIGISTFA
jgi:hypothetical protein